MTRRGWLFSWVLLVSCSNDEQGSSAPPYGLETRPVNTTCTIPSAGASSYDFVPLFENAPFSSFLTAMVVDPTAADRWFVAEQSGLIWVLDANEPDGESASVFLDLRATVNPDSGDDLGENGLLGFALHPDFATNGALFVYYSRVSDWRMHLGKFTVSDDPRVANSSEDIVFDNAEDFAFNHNGGWIGFGPDGYLYWSIGDGGGGGDPDENGQDRTDIFGSLLCLDVDNDAFPADTNQDYAIPSDNPFVASTDGSRAEIWAYGLRNAWQCTFDSADLWCADVGQDAREEIDRIDKGGNYGWDVLEGTAAYEPGPGEPAVDDPSLLPPIVEYTHDAGRCSVSGGPVYRGNLLSELTGYYVYGDLCTGEVWAFDTAAAQPDVIDLGNAQDFISGFARDADGELVVLGYGMRRIEAAPPSENEVPQTLSETGCFADLPLRTPATGLIPYDVASPLWSDGALKRRWLVMPDATSLIGFSQTGSWELPTGTMLIKEFTLETAVGDPASAIPLETRFLIKRANSWDTYTYRWNAAGTDADLLTTSLTATYQVTAAGQVTEHAHYFPSRSECLTCHSSPGRPLGIQTAQLNRTYDYDGVTDNQLRTFEHIGLLDASLPAAPSDLPALVDPSDDTQPREARARSYLHANCSNCHRPGVGSLDLDLRADTSLAESGLCAESVAVPGTQRLQPGNPDGSLIYTRMLTRDVDAMPPIATLTVDPLVAPLFSTWIQGVPTCP